MQLQTNHEEMRVNNATFPGMLLSYKKRLDDLTEEIQTKINYIPYSLWIIQNDKLTLASSSQRVTVWTI